MCPLSINLFRKGWVLGGDYGDGHADAIYNMEVRKRRRLGRNLPEIR